MRQAADSFRLFRRQLLLGFRQKEMSKGGWQKRESFGGNGMEVGLLVSVFGFDEFLLSANFECFAQIGEAATHGFGHVGNGFKAFLPA